MKKLFLELKIICNHEAIAQQIVEVFAVDNLYPTTHFNTDKSKGYLTLFFDEKKQLHSQLPLIKKIIKPFGLNYSTQIKQKKDWQNEWKKYFHTKQVSKRLVIKPSWEEFSPTGDQVVINIDPSMSFGTGLHETTRACLEFIDQLQSQNCHKNLSLIDIGCGSGILSIAALLLKYKTVDMFDYDKQAIITSKKNLQKNKVQPNNIFCADLFSYHTDKKYDLTIANILPNVLIPNAKKMTQMTKPSGKLILSGILKEQAKEVKKYFSKQNLYLERQIDKKQWSCLCFSLKK